jgi:hypothetical protein
VNAALGIAWLRHLAERLGWPGLLGIALVAGAGIAEFVAVVELDGRNAGLRRQVAQLRAQVAAGAAAALPASGALADLPGSHALTPVVAAVHAGARRRQVVLEQGEYLWQREVGSRSARYRMVFPVRGTYPQLRGWAADVLAGNPEMALEEFNFRRETVGSDIVEARVRFALRVEDRS